MNDKNKEKNYNEYHSERRLEHCSKHRSKYYERKWDQRDKGKEKALVVYSDDESSSNPTSSRSLSPIQLNTTDDAYFLYNTSYMFSIEYYKRRYRKTFHSTEAKQIHEKNKMYIKTTKLEVRREMFSVIRYICRVYHERF